MKLKIYSCILFCFIFYSCQKDRYSKFIGTWQSVYSNNRIQLISRIQFMKLTDFYIAAIEYTNNFRGQNVYFYICHEDNGSLIIKPDKYLEESNRFDFVLTQTTKAYFDNEFKNVYFDNFVFKSSAKSIFQFTNGQLEILGKHD
jgi:hypothetical protein